MDSPFMTLLIGVGAGGGPGPPPPPPPNVGAINGILTVKWIILSTFQPFLQQFFRLKHKF